MHDVIFNGSDQRSPSARASVELIFDNSQQRLSGQWGTYNELSVRRTLAREEGSRYFINNQQVRRRDIYDIFMGTGLGARRSEELTSELQSRGHLVCRLMLEK